MNVVPLWPLVAVRENCVFGRLNKKGKLLELIVPEGYNQIGDPRDLVGLTLQETMPTQMEAIEMGLVLKMVQAWERPYTTLHRLEVNGTRGIRRARFMPGKGNEVVFYQYRISPTDWTIQHAV